MMNIWLSPSGEQTLIRNYNSQYKSALAVYDRHPDLYDRKAQASIDKGEVIGLEQFLVEIGYALFTDKVNIIPDCGLSAAQVVYIRTHISVFGDSQVEQLLTGGHIKEGKPDTFNADYYERILNDTVALYEKPILDTDGNTHDFNRDKYNIVYFLNKLREAEAEEDGEEKDKKIMGLLLRIRHDLPRFHVFAESQMRPIRIQERLVKLNQLDKAGKLYSYLQGKRDNIKCMLGLEEDVCVKQL